MTKRDFFRTIIKLFGLYLAISTLFTNIPNTLIYTFEFGISLMWVSIASFLFVLLCVLFLLFRADAIIDFLHLDKGFDEETIVFGDLNNLNLLKFAVILIGAFLLVDYTPEFISQCYFAFKNTVKSGSYGNTMDLLNYERSDYMLWTISGIKVVLGYLMLTNYNKVARWLIRKEKVETK